MSSIKYKNPNYNLRERENPSKIPPKYGFLHEKYIQFLSEREFLSGRQTLSIEKYRILIIYPLIINIQIKTSIIQNPMFQAFTELCHKDTGPSP